MRPDLIIPLDRVRGPNEPLPSDHVRAHKLYAALFDEVQDLIKGKHLLIVPSGPLTQLPFQVLVTSPPTSANNRAIASACAGSCGHRVACCVVIEGPAPCRQAEHRAQADGWLRQPSP